MPPSMRAAFLISYFIGSISTPLSYASLALCILMLFFAVSGSYLAGGAGLINRDYLLSAGVFLLLPLLFIYLLPALVAYPVERWYQAARIKF